MCRPEGVGGGGSVSRELNSVRSAHLRVVMVDLSEPCPRCPSLNRELCDDGKKTDIEGQLSPLLPPPPPSQNPTLLTSVSLSGSSQASKLPLDAQNRILTC
ncbi:unnamed protein product [Pleuronectes platessa]|uniref:Uncharacterized protein n=1 Tax=Pleuronectes platessa TaxID=8262 RepID=A0A9N7U722_PLEPL|nr:unnamed protein product [Pleuronectes platessa]